MSQFILYIYCTISLLYPCWFLTSLGISSLIGLGKPSCLSIKGGWNPFSIKLTSLLKPPKFSLILNAVVYLPVIWFAAPCFPSDLIGCHACRCVCVHLTFFVALERRQTSVDGDRHRPHLCHGSLKGHFIAPRDSGKRHAVASSSSGRIPAISDLLKCNEIITNKKKAHTTRLNRTGIPGCWLHAVMMSVCLYSMYVFHV